MRRQHSVAATPKGILPHAELPTTRRTSNDLAWHFRDLPIGVCTVDQSAREAARFHSRTLRATTAPPRANMHQTRVIAEAGTEGAFQ